MEFFQKKFKFFSQILKTEKIKYFVEKGFKLWHKMFMKAKPRLSYCFCKVKCAKSQQFSFAGGFAGTPSLAVGLFYTCILQGARQVQGPCCTNPTWQDCCEKLATQLNQTVGMLRRMRNRVPIEKLIIIAEAIFNNMISCMYPQPVFEKEELKAETLSTENRQI